MKDRALAARYAQALLSIFTDARRSELADQILTALAGAMESSNEFKALLLDPARTDAVKKSVLRSIVEGQGAPVEMVNFLATLVDNKRAAALPSIAAVFHEEREKAHGIVAAEMTTATPLSDTMRRRAAAAVEKLTGRSVRLTCKVDPSLIGGAVTRIGSTVYDGSLRTQLTSLRRKMVQE